MASIVRGLNRLFERFKEKMKEQDNGSGSESEAEPEPDSDSEIRKKKNSTVQVKPSKSITPTVQPVISPQPVPPLKVHKFHRVETTSLGHQISQSGHNLHQPRLDSGNGLSLGPVSFGEFVAAKESDISSQSKRRSLPGQARSPIIDVHKRHH